MIAAHEWWRWTMPEEWGIKPIPWPDGVLSFDRNGWNPRPGDHDYLPSFWDTWQANLFNEV
jgi:hypothetical protein